MKEKVKKFISILKIEMIDLEEDISTLEEMYKKREENHEITHYVLQENLIVIRRELRGIHNIVASMTDIDPDVYSTLDELVADLDGRFRENLKDAQVPDIIRDILMRKLLKVKDYVGKA